MATVTTTAMLLTLMLIGCRDAGQTTSGAPAPPPRVREFLGEQAVAVLSDPQKVEVYRVADQRATGGTPPGDAPQVAGYEIKSTGRVQDAEFGEKLAAIFLSREPYQFNMAKACIFKTDTVLRVHGRDGARADFVLCFTCAEFAVTAYDAAGNRAPGGGQQHFDAAAAKLKALTDSAF